MFLLTQPSQTHHGQVKLVMMMTINAQMETNALKAFALEPPSMLNAKPLDQLRLMPNHSVPLDHTADQRANVLISSKKETTAQLMPPSLEFAELNLLVLNGRVQTKMKTQRLCRPANLGDLSRLEPNLPQLLLRDKLSSALQDTFTRLPLLLLHQTMMRKSTGA